MLAQALSLYRRHFLALVLTCAVALVPANLLAAGAVAFGLSWLGVGGVAEARSTRTQEVQQHQRDLQESPPPTQASRDLRVEQLRGAAVDGAGATGASDMVRAALPVAYATAMIAALLLAGLFLAHAAAVPLVLELCEGRAAGASHAWAHVATRLGAVAVTGLLGAALVTVGALCFIVPGLLLAASFSLAPAIAMREDLSGRAALEQSWHRLRGHWAAALGMWALIVAFSVLASLAAVALPPGPGRPLVAALVRVLLYPLPLAGLVLLYRDAQPQYIRRISAPG
ncbi:MAG TPA: hypothetical protein VFL36_22415 [Myxococcales bacterium]|nr:hypothetical protein [Myxococcales bacterium]